MDIDNTTIIDISTSRSTMVDSTTTPMEWAIVHTTPSDNRGIHGRVDDGMGHSLQQPMYQGQLVNRRTTHAHQLSGIEDYSARSPTSTFTGSLHQDLFRQCYHHCVYKQLWRNAISITNDTRINNMESMFDHANQNPTPICPYFFQPSRCSIATIGSPTGMELVKTYFSSLGFDLRTFTSGPLCEQLQQTTAQLYLLEMGPKSSGHQRNDHFMEQATPTTLLLPSMESTTNDCQQNHQRESEHRVDNTVLGKRALIPNFENSQPTTNGNPTSGYPTSSRPNVNLNEEQPPMEFDRLAYKTRRLAVEGIDDSAKAIINNPNRQRTTNKVYQNMQCRFIQWAKERQLDPFTAIPSNIINYLAYGRTQLNWLSSTCLANKTAILDLYTSTDSIKSNPAYIEFIKSLNSQAIYSFVHPTYNIQPALFKIRALGSNTSMPIKSLSEKTCFLLAITGFLRPSDLHRVDQAQSLIENNRLKLVVVTPKEKRSRRRIIKEIYYEFLNFSTNKKKER
jgi:hypothetical protein